jgi:AbrB family looped-hinge helix DNA binding protein
MRGIYIYRGYICNRNILIAAMARWQLISRAVEIWHSFVFVACFSNYAIIIQRWQMATETVVLGESGRIVLPAAIRKELGLTAGDRLTVTNEGGAIRILSRKMALEGIRADIIKQRGSLSGILDEFLAERREEAAHE